MKSRKHLIRRTVSIAAAGLFLLYGAVRPGFLFYAVNAERQQIATLSLVLFGLLCLGQAYYLLRRLRAFNL